jgi:hypothetical protein
MNAPTITPQMREHKREHIIEHVSDDEIGIAPPDNDVQVVARPDIECPYGCVDKRTGLPLCFSTISNKNRHCSKCHTEHGYVRASKSQPQDIDEGNRDDVVAMHPETFDSVAHRGAFPWCAEASPLPRNVTFCWFDERDPDAIAHDDDMLQGAPPPEGYCCYDVDLNVEHDETIEATGTTTTTTSKKVKPMAQPSAAPAEALPCKFARRGRSTRLLWTVSGQRKAWVKSWTCETHGTKISDCGQRLMVARLRAGQRPLLRTVFIGPAWMTLELFTNIVMAATESHTLLAMERRFALANTMNFLQAPIPMTGALNAQEMLRLITAVPTINRGLITHTISSAFLLDAPLHSNNLQSAFSRNWRLHDDHLPLIIGQGNVDARPWEDWAAISMDFTYGHIRVGYMENGRWVQLASCVGSIFNSKEFLLARKIPKK